MPDDALLNDDEYREFRLKMTGKKYEGEPPSRMDGLPLADDARGGRFPAVASQGNGGTSPPARYFINVIFRVST
jgi:hypothetical protein